jgi:sugar lactone lactonase YvrE
MSIPPPEPIGAHVSQWGEGPIWHRNRLLYVDIEAHKILSFDPNTRQEKIWEVGERVGTVVARGKGGLVWAGDSGIAFLDESTGQSTPVADPEPDLPNNRFNDGKCDPAGRFWAGTIHLASPRQPVASLYCLEKDLTLTKKFGNVMNSNGIVWTKDARTMYYIDTPRKNVRAFDYDLATGAISNERIVLDTANLSGAPDGMAIDAEDRLWIAFCHGSAIRCFDSKTFQCEAEIPLPCREVTACAFGGEDFGDLYITTGIPKDDVEPLAGRLFVTRPGAKGVASAEFGG